MVAIVMDIKKATQMSLSLGQGFRDGSVTGLESSTFFIRLCCLLFFAHLEGVHHRLTPEKKQKKLSAMTATKGRLE